MKSLLKIPYQVMKSLPQWTDRRLLQETPAAIASAATGGNYSVGGGFGVGMVSLFYSHQPQTSVPPVSDSKGGQQSLRQGCAPARIPLNVVVKHAAYEVHLTVDQVKSQVHAGKTFAQIAIARHITVQQLHVFVIHAQQQSNDYWPGLGCITWQDETSRMRQAICNVTKVRRHLRAQSSQACSSDCCQQHTWTGICSSFFRPTIWFFPFRYTRASFFLLVKDMTTVRTNG